MHPLNQMPELADRQTSLGINPKFGPALQELIGDPSWNALMPFRMGYPVTETLLSPRRGIDEVVV